MNNSALEYFKILKEIASVDSKATALQGEIAQENARITSVEGQRNTRLEYLQSLKNEQAQIEAELATLEAQMDKNAQTLDRLKQNLSAVTNVKEQEAIENQQATLHQEQDALSSKSFTLLERIEEIETELAEAKSYEQLSLASLQDIKSEVGTSTAKLQTSLAALRERIALLLGQLPENFQRAYQKVSAKNLKHGPFTSIKAQRCHICSFQVDRKVESDVEDQFLLKSCSSCSRIFIPDRALY